MARPFLSAKGVACETNEHTVIPEINVRSKKCELAAFKVFEIKCYLINADQRYM